MATRPLTASLSRRAALALAVGAALATGGGTRLVLAQGTDVPAPAAGPPALRELLACVSDWYLTLAGNGNQFWFYDDLKQQLDAFGLDPEVENGMPEELFYVTRPLLTSSVAFDYALTTDFTDAIGFQPLAVHQALQIGDSDHRLTLFRGGIDLETLPQLWEAAGYALQSSSAGHEIWTLGDPGAIDFTNPIHRYLLSEFNNVAVLGGDILAYAPDYAILERAADTRAAGTGSFAADPGTESLLATLPPSTVSCYAVPGTWADHAAWAPDKEFFWAEAMQASVAAVGPMPPWTTMIVGATVGLRADDPDAAVDTYPITPDTDGTVVIRILTASPDDAAQVRRVVEQRWTTGHSLAASTRTTRVPYTDYMAIARIGIEGSIATIDFAPVTSPGFWNAMLFSGDVFPFLYGAVQT